MDFLDSSCHQSQKLSLGETRFYMSRRYKLNLCSLWRIVNHNNNHNPKMFGFLAQYYSIITNSTAYFVLCFFRDTLTESKSSTLCVLFRTYTVDHKLNVNCIRGFGSIHSLRKKSFLQNYEFLIPQAWLFSAV